MLGKIDALPEELGEVETLLADTGYFSTANVEACEKAGIEPLIAMGRQPSIFLRGLDKVRGERSLVTMAWNMKRMFVLTRCGSFQPGRTK
jgi:IS5 family transposase